MPFRSPDHAITQSPDHPMIRSPDPGDSANFPVAFPATLVYIVPEYIVIRCKNRLIYCKSSFAGPQESSALGYPLAIWEELHYEKANEIGRSRHCLYAG